LIEAFSDDGALIYDPFMGSGTTGKAAVVTRRNYIGSEVVQEYCAIADKRIAEAKAANIWF
jgi:site-specific DNA-methyltransferase (adenine-specific)